MGAARRECHDRAGRCLLLRAISYAPASRQAQEGQATRLQGCQRASGFCRNLRQLICPPLPPHSGGWRRPGVGKDCQAFAASGGHWRQGVVVSGIHEERRAVDVKSTCKHARPSCRQEAGRRGRRNRRGKVATVARQVSSRGPGGSGGEGGAVAWRGGGERAA